MYVLAGLWRIVFISKTEICVFEGLELIRFCWVVIRKKPSNFTFFFFCIVIFCSDFISWCVKMIIINKMPIGPRQDQVRFGDQHQCSQFKCTFSKKHAQISQCNKPVNVSNCFKVSVYLWVNNTVLPEWLSNLLPYNDKFFCKQPNTLWSFSFTVNLTVVELQDFTVL